jgi:hypothetical protein
MSSNERHGSVKQEDDVLPPRLILYIILAALAFSGLLGVISYGIQRSREAALRPSGVFGEQNLGPIMERSNVHQEVFSNLGKGQVHAQTGRQSLDLLGWADEERRLVRVPIDVAMDIVASEAERGHP